MRGSDHHGNLGTIKKVASHLLKTPQIQFGDRSLVAIPTIICTLAVPTWGPHTRPTHEDPTRDPCFPLHTDTFSSSFRRRWLGRVWLPGDVPFLFSFSSFFTFYYELSSLSYFLNKNRTKKVYRDCTKKLCDELVHKKIVREIFLIKR